MRPSLVEIKQRHTVEKKASKYGNLNTPSTAAIMSSASFSWKAVIEHFTSRDITYNTDRFPTLPGVSGLIEGETRDEFFVGLWQQDFYRHLLWYTRPPGGAARFTGGC